MRWLPEKLRPECQAKLFPKKQLSPLPKNRPPFWESWSGADWQKRKRRGQCPKPKIAARKNLWTEKPQIQPQKDSGKIKCLKKSSFFGCRRRGYFFPFFVASQKNPLTLRKSRAIFWDFSPLSAVASEVKKHIIFRAKLWKMRQLDIYWKKTSPLKKFGGFSVILICQNDKLRSIWILLQQIKARL